MNVIKIDNAVRHAWLAQEEGNCRSVCLGIPATHIGTLIF
jgi:hypothetical protein